MKYYLLLFVGVLMLSCTDDVGTFQLVEAGHKNFILNTTTGEVWLYDREEERFDYIDKATIPEDY